MIVTCPECGEKISHEADRCSRCRKPAAGILSKEFFNLHKGKLMIPKHNTDDKRLCSYTGSPSNLVVDRALVGEGWDMPGLSVFGECSACNRKLSWVVYSNGRVGSSVDYDKFE